LLSLSPMIVYWEDTAQDLDIVKTKVLQLQATDPSLPGGVSEQKWRVGTLLSKLFDANGKIGNYFLKALGTRNNNRVLKWSWWAGGQFVDSNITDNWTSVWIGVPLNITWILTADKVNINWNFADGAWSSLWIIRSNSSNQAIMAFTDLTLGNQRWLMGLAAWSNDFTVWANSNANLLLRSLWSSNIQLLPGTWWVGIGKAPAYELDVAGDINFTWDLRQNWVVFAGSGWGKFVDGTDTDDAVYTAGNVWVWLANPSAKFQVEWNGATISSFINNTNNANGVAQLGIGVWPNNVPLDSGTYLSQSGSDNVFRIDNRWDTNAVIAFNTRWTGASSFERMRIDALGNVGIWITNPSERLSVGWNITATGTVTAATPTLATHLTTKWYVDSTVAWAADNLGNHTASQNIQLNWQWLSNDGGNEGIRINDSGSVSIGTTNTNGKLEIWWTPWVYWHLVLSDSANWWILNVQWPSWRAFNMRWNWPNQAYLTASNWALTELFINPQWGNVAIGTTVSPTVALQVNGNIIATDPTENSHVATKVYVDNAITVADAGDLNALSDARTNATNLFIGLDVGDLTTWASNVAVWQYAFQANTSWADNTAFWRWYYSK